MSMTRPGGRDVHNGLLSSEWPEASCAYHGASFASEEHARWAVWLTELGLPYQYQRKHFGFTSDYGFKPAFEVSGRFWLHPVRRAPCPRTRAASGHVAHASGLDVVCPIGRLFRPDPNENPPSPPLWVTSGYGVSLTRWFSQKRGLLGTTSDKSCFDLFRGELIAAFIAAESAKIDSLDT